MQRLFPILLLAAIVGGSWVFLKPNDRDGTSQSSPSPQVNSQANRTYPARNASSGSTSIRGSDTRSPGSTTNVLGVVQGARQPAGAGATPWRNPPANQPPTIRIATFNIQVFGSSKASKPHIMTTLATIARNFDVVAIQEIRTKDEHHLDRFLEYVNRDGNRRYSYIIGPRLGRSSSKEQYAFVYNTATIEVNRNSVYTVHDPDDLMHREPFVAMFRARTVPAEQAFTFVLVNVHTDPDETDTELDALGQVYHVVRQTASAEDDIIVLGDLNVDDQNLGELGRVPGVMPIVSGVFTNTRQNKLYDNIIIHRPSTEEFSGRWGVYDVQRLHNLTLDQALQVSDHLPVWAEFSVYESTSRGGVAARPGAEVQ